MSIESKPLDGTAPIPASGELPAELKLHLSCLASNLREVKRGLEHGLFGPPVPVGARGDAAQKWVNAAMHIGTIEHAILAAEYLASSPALRSGETPEDQA